MNQVIKMPKIRDYRCRAHVNPLSRSKVNVHPLNPNQFNWQQLYPQKQESSFPIDILDLGCGYGGLSIQLSEIYPKKIVLGIDIRGTVVKYLNQKVEYLRSQSQTNQYQNVAGLKMNAMSHLLNYIPRQSLEQIYICFPDPHFKKSNHRRRIISNGLLSEYAYLLKQRGRIYSITDVQELHEWHMDCIKQHTQFKILDDQMVQDDQMTLVIKQASEEAKRAMKASKSLHLILAEKI